MFLTYPFFINYISFFYNECPDGPRSALTDGAGDVLTVPEEIVFIVLIKPPPELPPKAFAVGAGVKAEPSFIKDGCCVLVVSVIA